MEALEKRGSKKFSSIDRLIVADKKNEGRYRRVVRLAKRGVELRIIAEKGGFPSSSSAWSFLDKNDLLGIWDESRAYRKESRRSVYRGRLVHKRHPVADDLVTSGLSLKGIAKVVGWPDRRWTYDYYRRRKLLDLYHKSKLGYLGYVSLLIESVSNEIKQELSTIVEMVQIQAYSKASDAERRTFEYFQLTPTSKYKWDALEGVLERYYKARKELRRLSRQQLCDGLNVSPRGLLWVLSKLNLPIISRNRRGMLPEEKEALKRAFYLNMSIDDISYFLPYQSYKAISKFMSELGERPEIDMRYLGVVPTNECASKIYQLADSERLKLNELCKRLQLSRQIVKHALRRRKFLEPIIIHALRVIYLDSSITTPYLPERE